jgi:hypothetical protein
VRTAIKPSRALCGLGLTLGPVYIVYAFGKEKKFVSGKKQEISEILDQNQIDLTFFKTKTV